MTTMTAQATQVYQVFIRATPERIWQAITNAEFTERYFYGTRIDTTADRRLTQWEKQVGEDPVLEWDPPRKLVHGWHSKWNVR